MARIRNRYRWELRLLIAPQQGVLKTEFLALFEAVMSIVERLGGGVESPKSGNCKIWAEELLKAERNFISSACVCEISCRFCFKGSCKFKNLGNEK